MLENNAFHFAQRSALKIIRTTVQKHVRSLTTQAAARRPKPAVKPTRLQQLLVPGAILTSGAAVFKAVEYLNDFLDDLEIPEKKEKVVVLGSGWAAMSFVDQLNRKKFDVTVVSPRNYFLFTPLLPAAAAGAVDVENIMEPVRSFSSNFAARPFDFIEAKAVDVDVQKKVIKCQANNAKNTFDVEYDKLVVAVGAVANTLEVKGAEQNALPLRDYTDARAVRNKIVDCLEQAARPDATEEDKKRLLHFVVVGGAPYAVEFAATLKEYLGQNSTVAGGLQKFVSVTLIDTQDHVNNFYDKSISKAVRQSYRKVGVNIVDSCRIMEVNPNGITLKRTDPETKKEQIGLVPCGVTVWSTGISVNPIVKLLRTKLPSDAQQNQRALVTGKNLDVLGAKDVFALGDCATVDQGALMSKWNEVFKRADTDNSGAIDLDEFSQLIQDMSKRYPALREVKKRAQELFDEYDKDKNKVLTEDEFQQLLRSVERQLTRFPSTATVAVQQGRFLGKLFNKPAEEDDDDDKDDKKDANPAKDDKKDAAKPADAKKGVDDDKDDDDDDKDDGPGFRYKHIGGFEYVGAEDGFVERGSKGSAIIEGPGAMWMWRAAYASKLLTTRMRTRMWYDYFTFRVFGRQATRV